MYGVSAFNRDPPVPLSPNVVVAGTHTAALLDHTLATTSKDKDLPCSRPTRRRYAGYGEFISKDKDHKVPPPITSCYVALCHRLVTAYMIFDRMSIGVQRNRQLSEAGGSGRLHAAGRVEGHAPSHRVPEVRPPPHLRPSGPRKISPSMARRLALPGSPPSRPFVAECPVSRPMGGTGPLMQSPAGVSESDTGYVSYDAPEAVPLSPHVDETSRARYTAFAPHVGVRRPCSALVVMLT